MSRPIAVFFALVITAAAAPRVVSENFTYRTASRAKLQSDYARLPMAFEPVQGPNAQAALTARGAGYSVRVRGVEAALHVGQPGGKNATVSMKLVGANANSRPEPVDLLPGKSNYLLGNDPKKWRTNVPQYRAVRYRNVYPGVNILYYGNQNRLEYDLETAPGADLSRIEVELSGADRISTGENGDLKLATAAGELRLHKPVVYQNRGAERKQIASAYRMAGRNRLRFELEAHDAKLPLVIDPVISFSAVLGGSGAELLGARHNLALDPAGNVYVCGYTTSADLPTVNPVQSTRSTDYAYDVMIAKLSADGSTLIYSTYLGGNATDVPGGLAVDSAGSAVVTGYTYSSDFPLSNPAQSIISGGEDVFVSRLNPAGNGFIFSTFLGGGSYEFPDGGVSIDVATGGVLVAGRTDSTNFPTTAGAFQTTKNYGESVFVTLFTPNGSRSYSTLIGGSGSGYVSDITSDASGSAYITGYIPSGDFPVTPGAFQTTMPASPAGYVAKLLPGGGGLAFSTYLGSSQNPTYPYAVAVDAAHNVYVAGETYASDFPVTAGAAQTTFRGASDGFLTKLNSSGSALLFSTFLGGAGSDAIQMIGLDGAGNIVASGSTTSADFPIVNPLQAAKAGGAFGLYASADGGSTWVGSRPGSEISRLRAAPSNPSIVYATQSIFIYRSTDGGQSFSQVGNIGAVANDLAVHPSNPSILMAATSSGVKMSVDSGWTWTSKMATSGGLAVAFAPSDPNTIYAGVFPSPVGLYKSTNGGNTWAEVAGYTANGRQIAVDPGNAAKVYVSSDSQVFRSSDGGATWASPSTFSRGRAGGIKVVGGNPSTVYASFVNTIYRSTDGGATWTAGPTGATDVTAFDVDPANPAVLYAASDFGILKSIDSGSTWSPASANSPLGKDLPNTILALPGKVLAGITIRSDMFVAKLSPSGAALTLSTYLGTSSADSPGGMAVGQAGDVYLAASSSSMPVTPGAYVSPSHLLQRYTDIFVMKISEGNGGCAVALERTSETLSTAPVLSRLMVSTGGGCSWTATTPESWISFPGGPSGIGLGTLEYMVAANNGSTRTGTITVNGETLTITQTGYATLLMLVPLTFGSGAGSQSATLFLTPPTGQWTASTSDSWITLGAYSGTGGGSVVVSVSANTGSAARTGTVTFTVPGGTATFTVNQSGQGCSTQLASPSLNVPAAGGPITVPFVSTPSNCAAWSAKSSLSWVNVPGPGVGTGSANAPFQVAANPWDAPRSGTITVGGLNFVVNQAAGSQCAAAPISLLTPINASLSTTDCGASYFSSGYRAKHYSFSGTAGQQIAIEMTSPTFSAYFTLIGPDGAATHSTDYWMGSWGSRLPSAGFYTLPASGVYQIEATLFFADTGSFQIQLVPACSVTLSPQGVALGSGAGSGSLSTSAVSGSCSATSYAPAWLTVTSGFPAVSFSVAASTDAVPRTGVISVGGQPFFVNQGGSNTFTFTPPSAAWPAQGGTASFGVSPQTFGLYAMAVALQPWLHVGPSGRAYTFPAASITYSVDPNTTGVARTGQIALGAQVFTVNQDGGAVSTGLRFVPVTPCRVADTRMANGPFGGPRMSGSETRSIPVPAGSCGIPANAAAYSVNVTVVPAGPLGYLTLWPAGQTQPVVSTLNSLDGRIKANAAIVPAGSNGAVSVFVSAPTDVILDINGYFVPASGSANLAFYPVTPCRVADTRNPTGLFGGPVMTPSGVRTFPVPQGVCSIPASAQAYSLNFTTVPQGPLGYLTTWPAGQAQPVVSTLNSPTGTIAANAAIVPAGTDGAINVYTSSISDVVIDINGYFAPPGGTGALSLYTVAPCRVVDTRVGTGPLGGPTMPGSQVRDFPVTSSSCSVPSSAQAYSLNATVVPAYTLGYLTLWPTGGTQPVVSTLNALDGSITANAALVPAGTNKAISAFVSASTDLILDINGYFAP